MSGFRWMTPNRYLSWTQRGGTVPTYMLSQVHKMYLFLPPESVSWWRQGLKSQMTSLNYRMLTTQVLKRFTSQWTGNGILYAMGSQREDYLEVLKSPKSWVTYERETTEVYILVKTDLRPFYRKCFYRHYNIIRMAPTNHILYVWHMFDPLVMYYHTSIPISFVIHDLYVHPIVHLFHKPFYNGPS
jgi:hypothetical protein